VPFSCSRSHTHACISSFELLLATARGLPLEPAATDLPAAVHSFKFQFRNSTTNIIRGQSLVSTGTGLQHWLRILSSSSRRGWCPDRSVVRSSSSVGIAHPWAKGQGARGRGRGRGSRGLSQRARVQPRARPLSGRPLLSSLVAWSGGLITVISVRVVLSVDWVHVSQAKVEPTLSSVTVPTSM
jgi:hypothetical protein